MEKEAKRKNIRIINLGGTITAEGAPGSNINYREGSFGIESVLRSVYNVEEIANLTYENFLRVASADISLADLLQLAKHINLLAADPEIDGFVLTHGTDTLEETAYFLHLTLKTDKPVILTGAMRPATSTSADGPMNIYQSVVLAAKEEARGQGVLVVFSDAIFSARDVQKISTFHVQAFSSRDMGSLGYIRGRDVYLMQKSRKPHTLATEFDLSQVEQLANVEIFYFSTGASTACFRLLDQKVKGLVLAGAGDACISKEWKEEVRKLAKRNFPVIRASRVSTGITIYDALNDGDLHSIPSYSLPPQKARILLMLALTRTDRPEEIRKIFERY